MMNQNYMRLVHSMNRAVGTVYLLDTYTATAAYSFRQLKTGVTNVCRVRRSSDSAESDFTATEVTDGTLTTWTGANDGFITKMYDQVDVNDFVQTTAANQPKIVSSGTLETIGGKPTALFDGVNDSLSRAAFPSLNAYPFSVFSVASNNGSSSDANILFDNRGLASYGILLGLDKRTNKVGAYNSVGANVFTYLAQENHNLQRQQSFIIDSSGNGEFWLDNISQDTVATMGAYSTTPTGTAYLGYNRPSASYSLMTFQEFIVFNSDETSNRSDIDADINTEYSIF